MFKEILFLFLAAALALLTTVLNATTASAAIYKKELTYNIAGRDYEGYVAYDDALKGPRPGILVAHNWMGITDETRGRVDELARLGYVAFAVDIYGKGIRPKNQTEAGQLAGSFKKDRTLLRAHMQEGLAQLEKLPDVDKNKIAVIGYCFGGTAALELARAGAKANGFITFHGGLDSPKPEDGKRIKGKVLVLHGADDPFNPIADVTAFENEMRDNKVDWEMIKYGGAVHSFTEKGAGNDNSKGAAYNAEADQRSWIAMKDFLKEIF
jgi:dienelactone hydrolase